METLNTTETKPGPKVAVRKHFDPTRLLLQRDRLPWFWFFFTVAVLLLSAMDRYHIVSQFKQRERGFGRIQVGGKIVNANLVEFAKHDITRTSGNKPCPVIESLAVVFLQVRAALFHFNQHNRFPNEVGERRAAASLGSFGDTE